MKPYRCPTCKESSCGDDSHTITKYAGPERSAGDCMKVILQQFYDLSTYHNLQVHEILGLAKASLEEHFVETDELNPK
jgi:hypothetical protein